MSWCQVLMKPIEQSWRSETSANSESAAKFQMRPARVFPLAATFTQLTCAGIAPAFHSDAKSET